MKRWLLITALVLGLIGSVSVFAQEEITVTWWTETDGIPANVQEAFIEPFEAANPGIRIELVGMESLNDVLRTAIQAGEAPDILQTPGASFIAETINAG